MKFKYDTNLIKNMTIRQIMSVVSEVNKKGLSNMENVEEASSCVFVWKAMKNLRFLEKALQNTLEMTLGYMELSRTQFTIIHRVNYLLYTSMLDVFDIVEDRGKRINGYKRNRKFVDAVFKEYVDQQRSSLSQEVSVLFQDYMRKANDVVTPFVSGLEEKALNYMVFHKKDWLDAGQVDDIELLVKIQTVLMFERVRRHSYTQFFLDFANEYGIDISWEFRYADLSKMSMFFRDTCNVLGVKFCKDKNGDYSLLGMKLEESSVFQAYWEKVIRTIRDEDLLDMAGREAIEQNEAVRVQYEKELEAIERSEYESEVGRLSDKFKVVQNGR